MKLSVPSFGIANKKAILALILAIAVISVIIYFTPFSTSTDIVLYFDKATVKAGESSKLFLELNNNLGKDMKYIYIAVTPIDPNTITVPSNTIELHQANFGMDEKRKFDFDVFVSDTAIEGSYSLNVVVIMDADALNLQNPDFKEERRIKLEVKR
ncbi:hypothetical protein DRN74_02510 [Candidatus Micrarchaeota archaeon]|nr:MAG: hypothetical protein DRN74_02510 [Candidatus Micrarchaeota archaeon]